MKISILANHELDSWFLRQRWIAWIISLVLILLVINTLKWLDQETLQPLLVLVAILGVSNIICFVFIRKNIFRRYLKESQIIIDLVILTFMLHYSGGIENSLFFLYLFHVILSGILLSKKKCYAIVAISFVLLTSLALSELYGIIPHYTLKIFPHSQVHHIESAPDETHANDAAAGEESHETEHNLNHASHHPVYVWSIILLALIIMSLAAYFITNIMEWLRYEEKIANEGQQRLAHVLTATAAGFLILDKDLLPFQYNELITQWFSTKKDEKKSSHPNALAEWIEITGKMAQQTFAAGITHSDEFERIADSGEKQFFQVTIAPLTEPDGTTYQVVELIQDITGKKKIEAEMIHAAKMVTLGTMAAGIAHEIGNPLASLSARLHLLDNNKNLEFLKDSIGLLQNEISRMERIVRGVSQLGRPSKSNWGICDINEIIRETIEILKYHKAAKYCKIITELQAGLPMALGVSDQIKQVFLNLSLNAVEAMENRGELEIITALKQGYLQIDFTDNGCGIPPVDREKIFQPFYSTKKEGGGLGLFIVNHIIQAHSGHIRVTGNAQSGTKFNIQLPLHGAGRISNKEKNKNGSQNISHR